MWNTASPGAFVPYLAAPIPIQTKYGPINVASTGSRLPRKAAASNPKQEDGNGIRGSDVLWALQRATAKKKKAKTKKKSSEATATATATATHKEKDIVDYSNVRPLEIKSEWSLRLDELEKRLQELEQEDTT